MLFTEWNSLLTYGDLHRPSLSEGGCLGIQYTVHRRLEVGWFNRTDEVTVLCRPLLVSKFSYTKMCHRAATRSNRYLKWPID